MKKQSTNSLTKNKSRNRFRIIAGQWRGRMLNFADEKAIRPTADRVRETLFNWLQNEIVGANCLDLFAGSGALGFEALSRGAATVTSLELLNPACQCIRDNIELLETNKMHLLKADALDWLGSHQPAQPFDIIFLDPPFSTEHLQACCHLLEANKWLSKNSAIYVESSSPLDDITLPAGWQLDRHKKAGQVFFGLCRQKGN